MAGYKPHVGYKRVTATASETDEYRRRNHRRPSVHRLECVCGKRIWGSGLAVASHRRACAENRRAYASHNDGT